MRIRFTLVAFLALSACAKPRMPEVSNDSLVATTPERARSLLSVLADDSMEGRGMGTPGSMRAARYIIEQMRSLGLQPGGDSGYFQRIPMALTGSQKLAERYEILPTLRDLDSVPAARRLTAGNVIGVLPGKDPVLGKEIVVLAAHYDHLGIWRPVKGDSIYNGADDNASGVVTVLEVARFFTHGPAPKRTIVFLMPTGEEWGLIGSNWFVKHPYRSLDQYVGMLGIELIGRPDSLSGGAGRAFLTGFERSTMGESFVTAGLPVATDKRPQLEFFQRSDNFAFALKGIVAHTLTSFSLQPDYHAPSDEVRVIDFAHMASVVNVTARAMRLLADGPRVVWKAGGRP